MKNVTIDSSLVRRIIDAGGELHREGARWRIGKTSEIISGREVRTLGVTGVLLGKRSSGLLKINPIHLPRKVANHVGMIGRTIVYRDTRYNWKKYYAGDIESRYVRGTIISINTTIFHGERALVIHPGSPEIVTVERPHRQAHWKETYSESVGPYAPGRAKHDANMWERIQKAGMLPAGWDAEPVGEPHTLARLRDVKRLLDMIGAPPVTIEEHIASSIFCSSPERLEGIRSQAFYARLNTRYDIKNSHIADAYDRLLDREREAIEADEAKAVTQYVFRLHEHACWKVGGSAIERLRARDTLKFPTLEETQQAIKVDCYRYSDNAIAMGHAEAVRIDAEFRVKMAERRVQFEKKFGAK